jgi:Ca2+-binding EF-hand superfamily protein
MTLRNLSINQLHAKLGFERNDALVDKAEFVNGLLKLDSTLKEPDAIKLVETLIGSTTAVDLTDITDKIGLLSNSDDHKRTWLQQTLEKIRFKVKQHLLYDELARNLEAAAKGQSAIETVTFKKILSHMSLGLTTVEINKLAAMLHLGDNAIDVKAFLGRMKDANSGEHEITYSEIAEKLQEFLSQQKHNSSKLLRALCNLSAKEINEEDELINSKRIGDKVPIHIFSLFLQKKIQKFVNELDANFFASCVDVDRDGYISKEDLETFLSRASMGFSPRASPIKSSTLERMPLYPVKAITEENIHLLLKELK